MSFIIEYLIKLTIFYLLFQRERLKKNYGMYGGSSNSPATAPATQPVVGNVLHQLNIPFMAAVQL